jgi:hypothetical protein
MPRKPTYAELQARLAYAEANYNCHLMAVNILEGGEKPDHVVKFHHDGSAFRLSLYRCVSPHGGLVIFRQDLKPNKHPTVIVDYLDDLVARYRHVHGSAVSEAGAIRSALYNLECDRRRVLDAERGAVLASKGA